MTPKTGDTAVCGKCKQPLLWNGLTEQWAERDPGVRFPGFACKAGGDHVPAVAKRR